MRATKLETGRFKVGNWVRFRHGARDIVAQVIESRGSIGINRRRLYGIRVPREEMELDFFEVPEDELQVVPPPNIDERIHCSATGGLVEILRHNMSGGQNQPKVWLNYRPRGDLTHTLLAERGIVGGATIPLAALYNDKVLSPKAEEVIAFLTSFELNRNEAERIISAVGTAP